MGSFVYLFASLRFMLQSEKLKSVVVFTKSEAALSDFRTNINAALI